MLIPDVDAFEEWAGEVSEGLAMGQAQRTKVWNLLRTTYVKRPPEFQGPFPNCHL